MKKNKKESEEGSKKIYSLNIERLPKMSLIKRFVRIYGNQSNFDKITGLVQFW